MSKDLEYYLGLSYPVLLRKIYDDEEEYYFAEVPELPGCMAHGSTPDEAIESIKESKRLWIEERLEQGYPVPEPRDIEEFSGKFVQRLPKVLHRELTIQAKRNSVSLNQYVVSLLAKAVGKEELREEILEEIRAGFKKMHEVSAARFGMPLLKTTGMWRSSQGAFEILKGPWEVVSDKAEGLTLVQEKMTKDRQLKDWST